MLFSERVSLKVRRERRKKARISSEVRRMINNENVVCVKDRQRRAGNQSNKKTGSRSTVGKKYAAILFCYTSSKTGLDYRQHEMFLLACE